MAKPWKPEKKTVEMRPSRIRRDPVPADKSSLIDNKLQWDTSERDIYFAVIGIIAFAVAIDIIIMAIGAYWN